MKLEDIFEKASDQQVGQQPRGSESVMSVRADGTKEWLRRDGKWHREDGPALESPNGTKMWYRDGKLHREDGPAYEDAEGTKEWCQYGKTHREDGPAYERADGTKEWYRDGKRHRADGPAVERADGAEEWWLDDKQLTPEQINKIKADLAEKRTREATVLVKDIGVLPAINLNKRRAPKSL